MSPLAEVSIEQAVRQSHCSVRNREHECVGTCTITPYGVELDCKLCGKDKLDRVPLNHWCYERAKEVLAVIGMDMDKLSAQTQEALLKILAKERCPFCNRRVHLQAHSESGNCQCGAGYLRWGGWQKNGATL